MTKNYYIKELMKIWGFRVIPFKTYYNLKNWSMDDLRLELRRYKENPQVLPYKPNRKKTKEKWN